MAVPEGKTFNLNTLEFEDIKKEETPPPAPAAKTEEPPADDPKEEEEEPKEETKKEGESEEENEEKELLTEEEEDPKEEEVSPAAEKKEDAPQEEVDKPVGIDDYVSEKFAERYGVNTEEELESALEEYATIQSKLEALTKENEELKAASSKPQFASEQEEKIFNFIKSSGYDLSRVGEGIQTAGRLIGLDIDNADPRILLEEKFAIEHPELTREESLKLFNREYNKTYNIKLEDFEDDAAFKEEQDFLKIQQKTQVAKAKEFLTAKQKELKTKPKEVDKPTQEQQQNPVIKTAITNNVKMLDEFMPKFNQIIYSPSDNEQDDFSINFSKEQLKSIQDAMKGWISNPASYNAKGEIEDGFDPDLKVRQVAYLMYGDDIAAKIYAHAMNQADIKRAEQIAKVKPTREAKTAIDKVKGLSEEKQQEMLIRKKQAQKNNRSQVYQ